MNEMHAQRCRVWRQISVFLEDRPGTLGDVCRRLGDAGVNIWALSLAEGIGHGYVRMICDDPDRAAEVLRRENYLFFEKEVLLLGLPNTPGSLAQMAAQLGAAGINIEYLYCASSPQVAVGLVVIRVDQPETAMRVLGGR